MGPTGFSSVRWHQESMDQAIRSARPGGRIGYPGCRTEALSCRSAPSSAAGTSVVLPVAASLRANYIESCCPVLSGAINPGRVFDLELPLAEVIGGLSAMDDRRAVKCFCDRSGPRLTVGLRPPSRLRPPLPSVAPSFYTTVPC
jgi:threonine dehydrogenase-like Zn-dependent dehydrogenase